MTPNEFAGAIIGGGMSEPVREPVPDRGIARVQVSYRDRHGSTVWALGWYVGLAEYPGGSQWCAKGKPNPKIILDDGLVIWGCECWWDEIAEDDE